MRDPIMQSIGAKIDRNLRSREAQVLGKALPVIHGVRESRSFKTP